MGEVGRVSGALVTGGAGDIGHAVARRLVAAGRQVWLADLDPGHTRDRAGELGPGAVALELDLTRDESIASVARAVEGRISTVVHCAGVAVVDPFLESRIADWDHMFQVNLRGPMQLTRQLLRGLQAADAARIVFVASDGARAGASGETAYAASKSGLFGFAKSLAREIARHEVTVNVVCPGPISGAMVTATMAGHGNVLRALEKAIPLKRLGQPDEVAALIAWLASPEAGYLTGQLISVSGGITMN